MSLTISRIDRVYRYYDLTATDSDGAPATPASVAVALLPRRVTPNSDTAWTEVDYADGVVTILYAGPAADPSGALAVPATGADVWFKVADNPEIDAERVERIIVQ